MSIQRGHVLLPIEYVNTEPYCQFVYSKLEQWAMLESVFIDMAMYLKEHPSESKIEKDSPFFHMNYSTVLLNKYHCCLYKNGHIIVKVLL